jgi:hypothetical protein
MSECGGMLVLMILEGSFIVEVGVGCSGGLSPTPDDERLQMDSASHAEAVRHALSEVATDDRASSSRSIGSASGSGSGSGSSWHFSEDELDGMETDGGT